MHDIQTGDVTQLVATLPAPIIVIACRISAYWDSADYFERLTDALRSFPRQQVLIDFFDRDLVVPAGKITFEVENGSGVWDFMEEVNSIGTEPAICKLKLKVSYALSGKSVSYEGYRSFFRKDGLQDWFQTQLKDYDVRLGKPLIDQDPSFTLKLSQK